MNLFLNIYKNTLKDLILTKSFILKCFYKWSNLYSLLVNSSRKFFTIHDGPPYANGEVHLGHAVNKLIKDIVIRKNILLGFKVNYLPGWDCFGLPIEFNVGLNKKYCDYYRYASSQFLNQKSSFISLGLFYNWDCYYKTMDVSVIFRELNAFYLLTNMKYVFVSKKSIGFCSFCLSTVSHYETETCSLKRNILFFFYKHISTSTLFVFSYFYNFYYVYILPNTLLKITKFCFLKFLFLNSFNINFFITLNKKICCRHKVPLLNVIKRQLFLNTSVTSFHISLFKKILFFPSSTNIKFYNSVFKRPYWCISRQRTWGIPILIWYFGSKLIINSFKIIKILAVKGFRNWKRLSLIDKYNGFKKCLDVLDVWFDSGLTHYTVLSNRFGKHVSFPSDIYIEGRDQHRGWFNSSFLTSVILNSSSPFRILLTHGFAINKDKKKMSKSLGNYLTPSYFINRYGLELFRFFITTSNYFKDIEFYEKKFILKHSIYKKILNFIGFLVSNTNDFPLYFYPSNLFLLDKYVLFYFFKLKKKINYYDSKYQYYKSFDLIYSFIFDFLSIKYLTNIKDRLYIYYRFSYTRLSCQFVLKFILEQILLLLSPYLSFSIEYIWSFLKYNSSIFLFQYSNKNLFTISNNEIKLLDFLFSIKKYYFDNNKIFKENNLCIFLTKNLCFKRYESELKYFFHVYKVSVFYGPTNVFLIPLNHLLKCPRCWNFFVNLFVYFCFRCTFIVLGFKTKTRFFF